MTYFPARDTLVLIGAGRERGDAVLAKAEDLYCGALFDASRDWADRNGYPWAILSDAYGCIPRDWILERCERSLIEVDESWNRLVRTQVRNLWPAATRLVFLCVPAYTRWVFGADDAAREVYLDGVLANRPLQGMSIDDRYEWLSGIDDLLEL